MVPTVLQQLNTSGTVASILLTSKGSILGCSNNQNSRGINLEVVSGVVANIWQDFSKKPKSADGSELETIILNLEDHNIVASAVCGQFIVCCLANKSAQLGMLKLKHARLCAAVAPTLAQIDAS